MTAANSSLLSEALPRTGQVCRSTADLPANRFYPFNRLPEKSMAPEPADTQAPSDDSLDAGVAAWVDAFENCDWPVLASPAEALEDWRDNEDAADAHLLADCMADDPLMTLKLLRHVARLQGSREHTDAETATEALVMLGITPFFRAFGPQPSIELVLQDQTDALLGLFAVLRRAERASRFALGFAVLRLDRDAAVIHQAALLHDFVELLLWVHAPDKALQIQRTLEREPELSLAQAQRLCLQVDLADVQHALMQRWRLPELLVRISDEHESPLRQVLNVQLAIRLARHSAAGWLHPALTDDVDQISALLNLATEPTLQLVHELDGLTG